MGARVASKHRNRIRDFTYMAWVKTQSCLLNGRGHCVLPIEADHAGERVGYRAPDSTCIPLCHRHHYQRTNNTGFFAEMSKAERLQWRFEAVTKTRRAFEAWNSPEAIF